MAQREFRQIYPQPGWVEHDPKEIWGHAARHRAEALAKAGLGRRATSPPSASPTSARPRWSGTAAPASPSTTPSSGRTGAPSHLRALRARRARTPSVRQRTGLIVDAYFSAPRSLDARPRARRAAGRQAGDSPSARSTAGCCGSSPAGRCTPPTSATRRAPDAVRHPPPAWDDELLKLLDVPDSGVAAVSPRATCTARRTELARASCHRRHRRRPAERAVRPGLLSPGWRRTPTAPAASC